MDANLIGEAETTNPWRKVSELRVIAQPGCEASAVTAIGAEITAYLLPQPLLQKLSKTLLTALVRSCELYPGAPLLIQIYVAIQISEKTSASATDTGAPLLIPTRGVVGTGEAPGWGFFLTMKKTYESWGEQTQLLHILEVFCYQEG